MRGGPLPPPREDRCPQPSNVTKVQPKFYSFDENEILNKVLAVPIDRSDLKRTLEFGDIQPRFTNITFIDSVISTATLSDVLPSEGAKTDVRKIIRRTIGGGCGDKDVVVDISSDSSGGIFGLYAASKGCKTIFFQPNRQLATKIYFSLRNNGLQDIAVVIPRAVDEEIIHSYIKDSYSVKIIFSDVGANFSPNELLIAEKSRSKPHSIILFRPYQTGTNNLPKFTASLIYEFYDAEGQSMKSGLAVQKLRSPGAELIMELKFIGSTIDLCYDAGYNKVVGALNEEALQLGKMKSQLTFDWEVELPNLTPVRFQKDQSVSFSIWNNDMIQWVSTYFGELEVGEVFQTVLSNGCAENEVVLDIGANTGYYGFYAASKGCKVIFFDPQPTCAKYLQTELFANGFYDHAMVIPRPVGVAGGKMTVSYETGCGGRFPMSEIEKGNAGGHYIQPMEVETVVIDNILKPGYKVKIAKIDTEGAESFVLPSLKKLIKDNRVDNIVVEVTPLFYPAMGLNRTIVGEIFREVATDGNYVARVLNGQKNLYLQNAEDVRIFAGETSFTQLDLWLYKQP